MPYTQPNDGTATYGAQEQGFGQEIEHLAQAGGLFPLKCVLDGATPTDGATGLQVDVAAGVLWYNGKPYYRAAQTLTCTTANATNPRLDYIVYDVSGTAFQVNAGTPATNPVPPAVDTDQILIAEVYVPAGATTLAAGNLIDKRIIGFIPLDHDTWYVDTVNGTDLGGTWVGRGRSWEMAYATMSAAVAAATAGDTIYVRGTYSAFTLTKYVLVIGTDNPNSSRIARSTATGVTLDWAYGILKVTGAVTITLPSAVNYAGKSFFIQRDHATNSVTIEPGTAALVKDGVHNEGTAVLATNGAAIGVYSDGADWIVAGDRGTVTYT